MTTYSIELTFTCPYIGSRNGGDKTVEKGLSLRQAREKLLDLYNYKFEDQRPFASNWGLAVIHSQKYMDGAYRTSNDGTRSFRYDGRMYSIEIEDNEQSV